MNLALCVVAETRDKKPHARSRSATAGGFVSRSRGRTDESVE